MLTLSLVTSLLILSIPVSGALLWLSARIARAGKPSFKRSLACVLVTGVLGTCAQLGFAAISPNVLPTALLVLLLQIVIGLLILWAGIARVFAISVPRSMLVSLPYIFFSAAFAWAMVFAMKSYLAEAFVISSNSMAPTMVGWHHEAICPHCKGIAILSAPPPNDPDAAAFMRRDREMRQPRNGICRNCRKITEFKDWPEEVHGPYRLVCNKLQKPQRGDATVFRHPRFPERIYVHRLVGLPNEKLEIKQGAVWINGEKWSPPAELSGLVYNAGIIPREGVDEERTWELGPDEFFVLGDFTTNASDSRDWGTVPRANLVGVATMIYWPPAAWRILK